MGFYDKLENVEMYIKMAQGYDGKMFYDLLENYLSEGDKVLELGSGEGKDIDLFSNRYKVIGSDYSQVFVNLFNKKYETNKMILLDAANFELDTTFDCIYSNKVLPHLSSEDVIKSLEVQHKHLNQNGIIIHSLWYGSGEDSIEGFLNIYYTDKEVKELVESKFEILEIERYTEIEENDSLYFIARVK